MVSIYVCNPHECPPIIPLLKERFQEKSDPGKAESFCFLLKEEKKKARMVLPALDQHSKLNTEEVLLTNSSSYASFNF